LRLVESRSLARQQKMAERLQQVEWPSSSRSESASRWRLSEVRVEAINSRTMRDQPNKNRLGMRVVRAERTTDLVRRERERRRERRRAKKNEFNRL
jgi:hypothetical protein